MIFKPHVPVMGDKVYTWSKTVHIYQGETETVNRVRMFCGHTESKHLLFQPGMPSHYNRTGEVKKECKTCKKLFDGQLKDIEHHDQGVTGNG